MKNIIFIKYFLCGDAFRDGEGLGVVAGPPLPHKSATGSNVWPPAKLF